MNQNQTLDNTPMDESKTITRSNCSAENKKWYTDERGRERTNGKGMETGVKWG